MRSSKFWLSTIAVAVPVATWAGSGCGGGGGSGGSGGAGGGTTATTTTTTSSSSSTGSSGSTTSASSSSGSSSTGGADAGTTSTTTSTGTGGVDGGNTTYCPIADAGAPPANHVCPGEAHAMKVGDSLTINGTTAGSTEDYSFCLNTCTNPPCSAPPPVAPNVVYAFTLATAGTFNAVLTAPAGSALVPTLDIRSDCAKPSLYCLADGTKSEDLTEDLAAGTYYVIVSGESCSNGAFTLTTKLTAETCGNSTVDPGEDCDPGPTPPANDGCGAPGTANECHFIAAPTGEDTCPGQAVAVPAGTTILPASQGMSTYGFKDDYTASATCRAASGATTGGLDRVFQLTPAASGTMTVSVGYEPDGTTVTCTNMFAPGCWASVLYARSTCADATKEIACNVGTVTTAIAPSNISFDVKANTPYWVFVDGFDGMDYSYGPFNLIVNLK